MLVRLHRQLAQTLASLRVLLDKHLPKRLEVLAVLMDTTTVVLYQQTALSAQVVVVQRTEAQIAEPLTPLLINLLKRGELFPKYLTNHLAR